MTIWTVSAEIVPVTMGHDNTLRCPFGSSRNVTDRSVKVWFHGVVSNTEALVARLVTSGVHVEYNYAANERIWIDSRSGDLTLQNLTIEDMGFYTCHFTGWKEQTIQLYTGGMFIWLFCDIVWVRIILVQNKQCWQCFRQLVHVITFICI